MIYNINTGGSEVDSKRSGTQGAGAGYGKNFKLWLTKYNKEPNGVILFEYAWPSNIGEIALSYDADNKVMVNVTFTFDRWQLFEGDGVTPVHAG